MITNTPPFNNKVPLIGEAALNFLMQSRKGKVLAAVNSATYLLTEEVELIWLTSRNSPKHRRCLLLSVPFPLQPVNSTFAIRDRSIVLKSGVELDFRSSNVWESPSLTAEKNIEIENLSGILIAVYESLLTRYVPVGFGSFIQPVLQIAKKQHRFTWIQPNDIFSRTAWPVVKRITQACLSQDVSEVVIQANELIGLGDGLTPSGDDFLGGLFFARYLLFINYPDLLTLDLPELNQWIDASQPRTNLISYVLLKDNINGNTLDPLNRFGMAILTRQPEEIISSSACELIKVGHSTGWSMLAGFLVGMLLASADQ